MIRWWSFSRWEGKSRERELWVKPLLAGMQIESQTGAACLVGLRGAVQHSRVMTWVPAVQNGDAGMSLPKIAEARMCEVQGQQDHRGQPEARTQMQALALSILVRFFTISFPFSVPSISASRNTAAATLG